MEQEEIRCLGKQGHLPCQTHILHLYRNICISILIAVNSWVIMSFIPFTQVFKKLKFLTSSDLVLTPVVVLGFSTEL